MLPKLTRAAAVRDAGTPDQVKAAKTKVVALAQKAAAKAR